MAAESGAAKFVHRRTGMVRYAQCLGTVQMESTITGQPVEFWSCEVFRLEGGPGSTASAICRALLLQKAVWQLVSGGITPEAI